MKETFVGTKIKTIALLTTVALLAFNNFIFINIHTNAAALNSRRITIGTSVPSAVTSHRFDFDIATAGLLGSIQFEYCDSALIGSPCTAPAGLDASAAVLSAQTGQTGFAIDPGSTPTRIVIGRPPVVAAAGAVSYTFTNVTNPSTVNQSFFVRITTHASSDATGPIIDSGAVVFVMTSGLGVGGYVPPYLVFCVGVTVGPQCTSTSGSFGDFGELSSTQTKALTSQFSGATNDPAGYSVYVLGTTMTSGNNIITPIGSPQASTIGASQFGINLRNNSNPDIGADKTGVGTSNPTAQYGNPDQYKYNNGDQLTQAANSTEYNVFTVSYIINISNAQPAGQYTTTLTYMAVAAF